MISNNVEFLPPIYYAVFWQPFWKWQTSWKFWKRRIAPLMVTYHYVKFYVSIIIHLEVANINVWNFSFPLGFYSNPHPIWTPQNMTLNPFTTKQKTLGPTRNIYIYNSTKFHEILSSSSWYLPWTRSCAKERKENNNNNNNMEKKRRQKSPARSPPNKKIQSPYWFTIDRLFPSIVKMFRFNFYRVSLDFSFRNTKLIVVYVIEWITTPTKWTVSKCWLMIPPLFSKQEVGIWRVKKRFPRYGVPIWSLWPNIRFLPSIVAEKNVTKNVHICSMFIKTN
jgi:hypothetical protein